MREYNKGLETCNLMDITISAGISFAKQIVSVSQNYEVTQKE